MIRSSIIELFAYRYNYVEDIIDAVEDFLKGPDYVYSFVASPNNSNNHRIKTPMESPATMPQRSTGSAFPEDSAAGADAWIRSWAAACSPV